MTRKILKPKYAWMLGICLAAGLSPGFSRGNDAPAPQADIAALEKAGIDTEESLGPDLWKNAKRSDVVKLLQPMPVASKNAAVQDLIFGVLLTRNEGGMIDDVKPAPGEDLFTLRIEKLIEAGAYPKAYALYTSLDQNPYAERLARAGITAMLLNGQKGLACIEARGAQPDFPGSAFLKQVIAYCDSKETIKPYLYDAKTFETFDLDKRAALAGSDLIDVSALGKNDIRAIPPRDLLLIAQEEKLSEDLRYRVYLQAASWGLMNDEDMDAYYRKVAKPLKKDGVYDESALLPWQKNAVYLDIIGKADDAARWTYYRMALALAKDYGPESLRPYARIMMQTTPPADVKPAEMAALAESLRVQNLKIPAEWTGIFEKFLLDIENSGPDGKISAKYIRAWIDIYGKRISVKQLLSDRLVAQSPNGKDSLEKIIENVDKSLNKNNNQIVVYEKDLGLTSSSDYVMPTHYVWHLLKKSRQEAKSIGETTLLSILALRDTFPDRTDPAVAYEAANALEYMGLTNVSEGIAMAAYLGTQTKGEN